MAAEDKHILVSEKEEKEERESLFVGYARVMRPTYDPYITVEQFAAKTLSSAIMKGKEVLFADINSAFRGGVKKVFSIDFEVDQLESYFDEEDFFIDLFTDEESGANCCSPGGPTVLCIKEIEWEKGEKFSEKIVYQLPQKEDVELKSDDDDDDEEEEEEEEEKEKEEKEKEEKEKEEKKKKDGEEKNQGEEEEEGTSTRKRKREESSTDGGEKGKKREKKDDGGGEKSVYIGFVRTMAAVYDPYVFVKQFVAKTRESAIEKGKDLYFQEVNERFRYGVTGTTSLDFEFEEIEKYPIRQFAKIWRKGGPGDNPSMRCGPGGPAVLVIQKVDFMSDGEVVQKKLFQLPYDWGNRELGVGIKRAVK